MKVVLNFHRGDQRSAATLLELLLVLREGTECTYHLQYGDHWDSLDIKAVIDRFSNNRSVVLSNDVPRVDVPTEMVENDPNLLDYPGNHTLRDHQSKQRHLCWNLCVYKHILESERFLMLEPDSVLLKQGWLADIEEAAERTQGPIKGHLKKGRVGGKAVPTHWAGSSVYESRVLQKLPLHRMFMERYANPWWPYRNDPNTETAHNCFWGPAFSGYDISYDYFLFALYWKETTGSNQPFDWPFQDMCDLQDVIWCDFQSRLKWRQLTREHLGKQALLHGIKDDLVRVRLREHFSA